MFTENINKKRIPLLNLLMNCLSARSPSQILSIKREYTFAFPNNLIIGLYNSYANSLLDILSFLIAGLIESVAAPPQVFFYQKMIDY